jgi:hypothetical protein
MSFSSAVPFVRENPSLYSTPPRKDLVYEVSLRTTPSSSWLKELQGAHRLVQALLQGQLLGLYELLDFVVWPDGLFARVSLRGPSSLSEFLKFLKEKTVPSGEPTVSFWDDELQWIKLIPEDRLEGSTRLFLETADRIRKAVELSGGYSPNLFFYYRNPRRMK